MAIDHMLFNKLKWFNTTDNVVLPQKVLIKKGAQVQRTMGYDDTSVANATQDMTATVTGYLKFTYNSYGLKTCELYAVDSDIPNDKDENGSFYNCVVIDDHVSPIWGGKRLLSHWYNKACRLLEKEAVAC